MIFEKKTKTIQDLEIRLENWKYFLKEKKKRYEQIKEKQQNRN